MLMIAHVLAALIALIHFYIFYLESIAWGRPKVNMAFRMSDVQAEANRVFAFNQGFYNLFLALAIIAAFVWQANGHGQKGQVLMDYAVMSVFGAGTVLFFSGPGLLRPALVQALPALLYVVARIVN